MEIAAEKIRLRQEFKSKRAALLPEEVLEKSRLINENFISNLLPKIYQKNSGKIFSIYFPSNNEVATDLIARHFEKNKIEFSYPKITEKNQPLKFILAESGAQFVPNKFFSKLFEPAQGKEIFPDYIILPLLAFDQNLSRLGMGGGFFDRTIQYLKSQKPEIITIGLAYYEQRARQILPIDKTDQRLDFIVTEKRIFLAS